MKRILICCVLLPIYLVAQRKTTEPVIITDTVAKPAAVSAPKPAVKAYKDVITTQAQSQHGLFSVHKVDGRYFFEIPDTVLGRDILVVNRLSKTSLAFSFASASGYAGDILNEKAIRFDKGPNNRIFLRYLSYTIFSNDSASSVYQAVMNTGIQPIAASFDIKAFSPDGKNAVIDLTDFINTDNDVLGFESRNKTTFGITSLLADRSYVVSVKTYPLNTEIRTLRTYTKPGTWGPGTATLEVNSSLLLLPAKPMKPRNADDRIGYFTTGFTDLDIDPQGVKKVTLITRWRLEPKEVDKEKYQRGELVEPAKPIVIYIDPATPEKWVPYLIQGVNDWQRAFEKAGFKNAIIGKKAPTVLEDSTWSLEDARYSALVYKPSSVQNATGLHVHDPRSGEILETHIDWYHNVMTTLRDWYFIQAAVNDPRGRKEELDDDLMGRLIRFAASHEVGHTMGLLHNFSASSTVPVEKLRDKTWLTTNGHTPSIMDYARFNYVAQPEDGITGEELMPRIGAYDEWAIEWGYRWLPPFKSANEETAWLNKWTIERLKDKRLLYAGESSNNDPRTQTEDLGDNAMLAGEYGIRNLKRLLTNLELWTGKPDENYDQLDEKYRQLTFQLNNYIGHVLKNIGGIYITPKTAAQGGPVYETVPAARQLEAMAFLNNQVFKTPLWLLNQDILKKTGKQPLDIIGNLQTTVIYGCLNPPMLERLAMMATTAGPSGYSLTGHFNVLRKYVWAELNDKRPIDPFRRNLQKLYVEKLKSLLAGAGSNSLIFTLGYASDVRSVVRGHLKQLGQDIKARLQTPTDTMTRYHLDDLLSRIDVVLHPK